MNWLFLTITSLIFFGAIELFYKKYSVENQKVSANVASIVTNIFILLFAIPFFLLNFQAFSLHSVPWTFLLIENILYVVAVASYYESYKTISASIATILGMISVVITTTIGIIFFSESISLMKFVGIALVILSITALNWEHTKVHMKGYILALLGGLFFGLAYTFDKYIVTEKGLPVDVFQFLNPFFSIPLKMLLEPKGIVGKIKSLHKETIIYSALAGLCIVLAYKLIYTAYAMGGEVGKIDAINNLAVFVVILGEIIFFKDRSDLRKKCICATLAVFGICLLR